MSERRAECGESGQLRTSNKNKAENCKSGHKDFDEN